MLAQSDMDSMVIVSVDRIISQRHFGTIFAATGQDNRKLQVHAKAEIMLQPPTAGETWIVKGIMQTTCKYGEVLYANVCYRTLPDGQTIVRFLTNHVQGIGLERAENLWREFGIELASKLRDPTNIEQIAKVLDPSKPRLSVRLAALAIDAWSEANDEAKLVEWMTINGIQDTRIVPKVARILGASAVERLQSNPWILVSLMAWSDVDKLGLNILKTVHGISTPHSDKRRLVGAVDAAAKKALENGITAFDAEWLQARLAKLLGVVPHSDRVQAAISAGIRNSAVIYDDSQFRVPGAALMENDLKQRLEAMKSADYPSNLSIFLHGSIEQVIESVTSRGDSLDHDQRAAVIEIMRRPLAVLQGGAGVGKTFTMRVVCDAYAACGWKVVLCALAGKAALRLRQATARPAMTLSRLIGQLSERERIEQEIRLQGDDAGLQHRLSQLVNIDDHTIVIIDEASMVDLATAYGLVKRMPIGSRLLMTGDESQLPPVGFGLVYHLLVKDSNITSRLTKVHRQSEAGGIPSVSKALRDGTLPTLATYDGKGEGVFLHVSHEAQLEAEVARIVAELGGHKAGVLIVSPTNKGLASVQSFNRILHDSHVRKMAGDLANFNYEDMMQDSLVKGFGTYYARGEPVIFLANDYQRDLFNGLLGRVTKADAEQQKLHVQFDGAENEHVLTRPDFLDLSLAYAITCHRAQGSQAPRVVIPLYETENMDPSWIYTAVTRAEKQVVLVGSEMALQTALARRRVSERRTVGLKW